MALDRKRFMAQIYAVKPGNYDMRLDEVLAIYESSPHDVCNMVYDSFRFGFLKGQRAMKAKMKKKRSK